VLFLHVLALLIISQLQQSSSCTVHETGEATTPNLKVVSLMELVDEEEVKDGALPSRTRSSDHIAIAAKFKLHRARNWRGQFAFG